MSRYRTGLLAITTLFTAGLTSVAFAGCCGWGVPAAPIAYAAPVGYAGLSGCGGCAAPMAYAAPIAYAASGCGSCGATLIAPSPIYVVNQGPHYAGPAIMTYKTYATGGYAGAYPYVYRAGSAYTGYDGGPYANPANYLPSRSYIRPIAYAPAARIIHRHPYIGPRMYRHSGYRHHVVPRANYYYRRVHVRG